MDQITGNAAQLREFFTAPESKAGMEMFSLWNSPESLAAHVAAIRPESCWYQGPWGIASHDVAFRASRSMGHAADMCRDGWPEGAARAARLRDRIAAQRPIGPRLVHWDIAGAYASVPRALSGNPMHMRRIDSAKMRRRPVLTIMSDYSVPAMMNANCLVNRAAVVAAVVDAIEGAGYSCEVIAFSRVTSHGKAFTAAAITKEASQPADIGRMAYALGHAAYFRRLCFALLCNEQNAKSFGTGLGNPSRYAFTDMPNTYLLPAPDASRFGTEEAAATRGLDYLLSSLASQGCPAFPQASAA